MHSPQHFTPAAESLAAMTEDGADTPSVLPPAASSVPAASSTSSSVSVPAAPDTTTQLVLRALVSTKEAGVIIGKDGQNVADMRDAAKVKAGVTKSVSGIPDRILSVAGTAAGVAQAFGLAAAALVANPPSGYVLNLVPPGPQGTTTVRLLIPHQRMGSILGKGGARIKAIQAECDVRIVASKHRLPHSSERIVEIQGSPAALERTIFTVVQCLLEEKDKSILVAYYNPKSLVDDEDMDSGMTDYVTFAGYKASAPVAASVSAASAPAAPASATSASASASASASDAATPASYACVKTTTIPATFAGYIIGKRGENIRDLRKRSGAAISISSEYESERTLMMRGSFESVARAMGMLEQQMEDEKMRRDSEQGA